MKRFFYLTISLIFLGFLNSGCSQKEVSIKSDRYQAIYLTNGQIYYGKLTNSSGPFFTLEDVYYLWKNPNAKEGEKAPVQLIKMGNEFHKPEDILEINKDHIAYVANLKNDGQVVTKILEYQTQQAKGDTKTATPSAPVNNPQLTPQEMQQFKEFQKFKQIQQQQAQAAEAEAPKTTPTAQSPSTPPGPEPKKVQ